MSFRDTLRGKTSRAFSDSACKTIAVILWSGSALVFGATAIYGVNFIGRLGGAGWFIYVVLMGTFAMVFAPVVSSAHGWWQRGSPKHRKLVKERHAEQASKYRFRGTYDGTDDADSGPES